MAEWTIDVLARDTGTTVRSIRTYHERGLLPSPTIRRRVGYYDERHAERLQAITRLLDRGFTLAAIKELFDAHDRGEAVGHVLGFMSAVTSAHRGDESATISSTELAQMFPTEDPALLRQAIAAGIVQPATEGEFRVDSRRVLEITAELVAAGLPMDRALAENENLGRACDEIAQRFAEVFDSEIWQPFLASDRTDADLERVTTYLRNARSLPGELVGILVEQALRRKLDAGTDEMLNAVREQAETQHDRAQRA